MQDWLSSVVNKQKSKISAKVGANFTLAGIMASKSSESGGKPMKIKEFS